MVNYEGYMIGKESEEIPGGARPDGSGLRPNLRKEIFNLNYFDNNGNETIKAKRRLQIEVVRYTHPKLEDVQIYLLGTDAESNPIKCYDEKILNAPSEKEIKGVIENMIDYAIKNLNLTPFLK